MIKIWFIFPEKKKEVIVHTNMIEKSLGTLFCGYTAVDKKNLESVLSFFEQENARQADKKQNMNCITKQFLRRSTGSLPNRTHCFAYPPIQKEN